MHRPLAALLLLVVAACGNDEGDGGGTDAADATPGAVPDLPAPEGAVGSVTGMPANPGPGASPIQPVVPAQSAWPGDATSSVDGIEAAAVAPSTAASALPGAIEREDPPADAPPLILVPEIPQPPVATTVEPEVPDSAGTSATPEPIGTEGATESTTFTVDPDEGD